ncbi:hypothetical protein [Anabaena azotica]|uniref:Uncharacterized protein n=1 Tax=Anabaena azotica FACHB-119 TaxID=947527 RepID=A0ABR8D926_9NOST|nr:hypothetical protein [Anabaena azotica]MBD2503427.1 hypothetical protein [Anabaena azotica FACHB-119]
MHSLTESQRKLAQLQEILSQLQQQKSDLSRQKETVQYQLRQLEAKEQQVINVLTQAHRKRIELERQIEREKPPVSKKIQLSRELLELLNGNAEVGHRLIESQQRLNPGRTDDWYLDKVMWDLRRDRQM